MISNGSAYTANDDNEGATPSRILGLSVDLRRQQSDQSWMSMVQ